jgi:hypothetical protein
MPGTRAHAQGLFRQLSPGGGSWAHSAVPGGLHLAAVAGHGAAVDGEVNHQLAAQLRAACGVAAR